MPEDIRVTALLSARPREEGAVRAAGLAGVSPLRAESTTRLYTFSQDSEDASLFVFIEHWDGKTALDAHCADAAFQALASALEGK